MPVLNYPGSVAEELRRALAGWYDGHQRDLPWRRSEDPYQIWVSEVMLQQTRVDQALPYFERFIAAFPDVRALARADLDDVLRHWEGLGYYARARNMHRAARILAAGHGGRLPADYLELRSLPGIGPYTAAAVASIAFGLPHAVLDGNVARVIARIAAYDEDIRRPASRRALQEAADRLLNPSEPANHNQAMMELGARICTPARPRCTACPAARLCLAALRGEAERYPVTGRRGPVPHHDIAVGVVVRDDGRVLIARRPENGMLGGLWEFPGGKVEEDESPAAACIREMREEMNVDVRVEEPCLRLSHAYTHFKITLHAFWCRLARADAAPDAPRPFRWVTERELDGFAFPRANRRLIEHIQRNIVTGRVSRRPDLSQ